MSWGGRRSCRPALALAAALVCLSPASAAATTPTTLHVAASGLPDALDPQLSYTTEGWSAMYDTYIPLLTYRHASGREGSEIIPGLARGLPKITDGGTTYTLFLRPGLRYSDRSPVRASDFERAIERLFELNSGGSPFYDVIAGAKRFRRTGRGSIGGIATNDRTRRIAIHLTRPRGTFLDLLALPFAAPVPPGTPARSQTLHPPPATGPYAFARVEPGVGWTYERNPEWATHNGPSMPQLPGGHVDRIEVQAIPNGSEEVEQVRQGSQDLMLNQPPAAQLDDLRRRYGDTQFRSQTTLSTYYFWMNTAKPPFNDLRVRRAVNLALDREALSRIYGGAIAPSQQILPPAMPGYRRLTLYPYDLPRARKLIAAADPADRDITVWTDTEPGNREAGAYYRRQLQRLGFQAHLKAVSPIAYFTAVGNTRNPDLDTGWGNWFADYAHPDDFFDPQLSGSSIRRSYNGNFARADFPALNAKIATLARARLGPVQEREYAALDRSYTKQAPWVPYGSATWSSFVSSRVDLDKLIWNPLLGTDLASAEFRSG